MIRVALVCDQLRLQQDVLTIIRQEGFITLGSVNQRAAIREQLHLWSPDAVIVVSPFGGSEVGALVQQIQAAFPALAVVVVSKDTDPEHVRHLFRSGARDVLPFRNVNALPGSLREAVRGRANLGSGLARSGGSVVAVWSSKGGVGCSLLAANLAVALQIRQRRSTLLADLNGPFGGIHGLLGLKPERTMSDLFRVMPELNTTHLAQAVTTHSTGLSVLCAPRLREPLGGLLADHVVSLSRVCRSRFDVTVLDLPAAWVPPVEAALEVADRLLMVLTPDAPAVRAAQAGASLLPTSKRERLMAGLVVNRLSPKVELNSREIEQMVGLPIVATIRADFAMLEPLINTGQSVIPMTKQRREAPVAHDLLRLAERLA